MRSLKPKKLIHIVNQKIFIKSIFSYEKSNKFIFMSDI